MTKKESKKKEEQPKKTKIDNNHEMSISSSVSTSTNSKQSKEITKLSKVKQPEDKERWLEWTTPIWHEKNQRWEFYQKQEGTILEIFHSESEQECHDMHKSKIMTHIMAETQKVRREEGKYNEIATGVNVNNKTHSRNPKEGKQKSDTSQFIHQQLMYDMMEMKLEGVGTDEIEQTISKNYGISLMSVGLYYSKMLEQIRDMAKGTIVDTLQVHLSRYEELYRWFVEEGYGRWALKVLEKKEKLLGLHSGDEMNTNLLESFIEGKSSERYNWENLTVGERDRLALLVKRTIRVLKPVKEEGRNE